MCLFCMQKKKKKHTEFRFRQLSEQQFVQKSEFKLFTF